MTPDQIRAARGLLGWSRKQLGARSGISLNVVKVLEQDGRAAASFSRAEQVDAEAAIRTALEQADVEFTSGNAPGVKLRKAGQ